MECPRFRDTAQEFHRYECRGSDETVLRIDRARVTDRLMAALTGCSSPSIRRPRSFWAVCWVSQILTVVIKTIQLEFEVEKKLSTTALSQQQALGDHAAHGSRVSPRRSR